MFTEFSPARWAHPSLGSMINTIGIRRVGHNGFDTASHGRSRGVHLTCADDLLIGRLEDEVRLPVS
jgi:hypothetical protein